MKIQSQNEHLISGVKHSASTLRQIWFFCKMFIFEKMFKLDFFINELDFLSVILSIAWAKLLDLCFNFCARNFGCFKRPKQKYILFEFVDQIMLSFDFSNQRKETPDSDLPKTDLFGPA